MMRTKMWNSWPASYNDLTLPFYLIYLILITYCTLSSGTFTVQGPLVQPTLAWVGQDILLSCLLSPKMDARRMIVKWVRGPEVVHLYHNGKEVEDVQAPAFQGRTKMLRQDMAEGKVTVSIHRVQFSDVGQFTCYVQSGTFYSEASFELQVEEPPFSVTAPAQSVQAKQGENVILSSVLSPKMDAQNMTVKWFRNQTLVYNHPSGEKLGESQGDEFQGRMELLKHDLPEGKVTLRIQQVQVSDSGSYTCGVHSLDYSDETHIELQVTETLHTSQKISTGTIITVFLVVLICSPLVIHLCIQKYNQST
ncbi:butyrophilin-like protein 8 isoform X2 [Macrotis lagotis]|uniref:butyrophilin-like protein 8 isoform X2 n=1 Tax=Macrotis lagotis TaxID=92651 RepID=UPI003D68A49E